MPRDSSRAERGGRERPADREQVAQLVARGVVGAGGSTPAARRGRPARLDAVAQHAAPAVITRCSSSSVDRLAPTTRAQRRGRRDVGTGSLAAAQDAGRLRAASLPATIASTTRGANTSPSSSEFDASRFAPCTPEHAASPHDQSPGSVDAPSRSVATPPQR